MYVDDIKLAGKKQIISPTWKVLMKDVDLGEPKSFLDHVYLGCIQRECQVSDDVVANYRDMFESRILAGAKENYSQELQGKLMQKSYRLGFTAWKVMQRNAWKDIANLQRHALRIVYSLFTNCSEMSVFGSCWEIFDITWSANKFVRDVTKWTKACDKRLARLISQIHHTSEFRQY